MEKSLGRAISAYDLTERQEPVMESKQPYMGEKIVADEYIPPRQKLLTNYEISIQFLSIGCIIRVGCKTIAFSSVEEAMKELNEYVKNPYEVSKKWNKIFEQQ